MSNNNETALIISDDFKAKVKAFKEDFYAKYKAISNEETPQVDGEGRKIVDKRPDGYDYIIEAYMRDSLDRHFPGWSWEMAAPLQFLGAEWVVSQGHLVIIDEHLLLLGINPPIRKFYGCEAAQIQYKHGQEHVVANIIDVGNNVKGANASAFKVAVNRLTHIGDDIYGKRIEEEGAGTFEELFELEPSQARFAQWVNDKSLSWGDVCKILGVANPAMIKDFKAAYEKIKQHKGWK